MAAPTAMLRTVRISELKSDVRGVSLPSPRVHIVARFGDTIRGGVDVHAMGVRHTVHRKAVRGGHRTVIADLQLGACAAVLGASAAALDGRIVCLDDLWGSTAAHHLTEQLAAATSTLAAAEILQTAVAARARVEAVAPTTALVRRATALLQTHSISDVAALVGVSERHLRRAFGDVVGVGPKQVAQLQRFRRALRAARQTRRDDWAAIAVDAGYYDHSHLIAAFHQLAGTTPAALLTELQSSRVIG